MIKHINVNKTLWILTAYLTIIAALTGILNTKIYDGVIPFNLIPSVIGQDMISLIAGIVLGILAIRLSDKTKKDYIIPFGILGYLFYAYGIYVIEQVYNPWYLAYLAIFGLSFWGLVFGIASIKLESIKNVSLPEGYRKVSMITSLSQPVIFCPLWILALIPLLSGGDRIESLFSIYILDLVFVMPMFGISAWLLYKKHLFGYILTPIILILGFIVMLSLLVSEFMKPQFNMTPGLTNIVLSTILATLFLGVTIAHFKKLNFRKQ